MDGVYETANTLTVDLAKVKQVTNNGGGNACGDGEFNSPSATFAVSRPNTKALKAWATAPNKNPGIDTGQIKVYLRKTAADYPTWDPETAASLGPVLSKLWPPPEGGGKKLDSGLANEIAGGLSLIFSDLQLRVEQAGGQDIDINGSSDKNGAEEFYKLITFQYPASYYKNKTPVSWTPDVSATVTPSYWGSWNDTDGKMQIEIDKENFCKSSLMLINTEKDWGYWYNDTVTSLPTVNINDLETQWNGFKNNAEGPLIEFIVGSMNGNVPPNQIWSFASNGAYAKFQADFDRTSYGSFAFHYDLGNSFAQNGLWSKLLPDGVEIALPFGMAGKAAYEEIQPWVNPFLNSIGIGAGFTDTPFQAAVNSARVEIPADVVQETTNLLLDLLQGAGSLFQHRPEIKGPPIQNYQNNDISGDDRT